MKKKQKHIARCPCCKIVVDEQKLQRTIGRKINYGSLEYKLSWNDLLDRETTQRSWVCDDCLDSRKAIIGDVRKQLYLDYLPHFAYFDQDKTCQNCGDNYTFTKEEQQHWYEILQFWVQAESVNCKKCYQLRKLNTELSNILKDKSKMSLTDYNRVIEIYTLMAKMEKVKEFEALKRKLKK